MYILTSSPALANCLFLDNAADGYGGGIYNLSSSPTLAGVRLEGNSAGFGAGMFNNSSSPELTNCIFTTNSADEEGGGMISILSSNPTLSACSLCSNTPEQISGPYEDLGGSCITESCDDCDFPTTITVCASGCDFTSVNAAISAANDYDVIQLAAETYFEGEQIDTLGKAIIVRGASGKSGEPATVLDGSGEYTVLVCQSGETGATVFRNLVIQNGLTGMSNNNSSPTLTNCTFTGNSTGGNGGGMYNSSSSPTLTDCTFTDNSANNYGGGMYNWNGSSPTLTGCTFTSNSANYLGGGMYNGQYGDPALPTSPTLAKCTFVGNSAGLKGGGIYSFSYFFQGDPDGTEVSGPALIDCTLCGNGSGQLTGSFTDLGGNCLSYSCDDDDGDGIPDECSPTGGSTLFVPAQFELIEDAVEAAAYGDVVLVAAGTYFPSRTINPGGKPITIRGEVDAAGSPVTVIDGGGQARVLECSSGESPATVFENLVIQNGAAVFTKSFSWFPAKGGGLFTYGSSPSIRNCVFTGNIAIAEYPAFGGGVYCYRNANPTFSGCVFSYNEVIGNENARGGGIGVGFASFPSILDCIVCENTPENTYQFLGELQDLGGNCIEEICDNDGDGIFNCVDPCPEWPYQCSEDGQTFTVAEGQSIHDAVELIPTGGTIEILAGTFLLDAPINPGGRAMTIRGQTDGDGNPAVFLDGQGLTRVLVCQSGENSSTVFENLVIQNGYSSSDGGGMFSTGSPSIAHCVFVGNVARNGGGMFSTGNPDLLNCSFNGNSAQSNGGGLWSAGAALVTDSSFTGNVSESGGAIAGCGSFIGCDFSGNIGVSRGGAISCMPGNPSGFCVNSLFLAQDCVFESNYSQEGGALYLDDGASAPGVLIEDSSMTFNVADFGGAIVASGGNLSVQRSVISENTGMFLVGGILGLGSAPELIDTVVCGNSGGQISTVWEDGGGNCIADDCVSCEEPFNPCPTDLDRNGLTDGGDLGAFFIFWGECQVEDCLADFNDDEVVDGIDLGILFSAWGPCQ